MILRQTRPPKTQPRTFGPRPQPKGPLQRGRFQRQIPLAVPDPAANAACVFRFSAYRREGPADADNRRLPAGRPQSAKRSSSGCFPAGSVSATAESIPALVAAMALGSVLTVALIAYPPWHCQERIGHAIGPKAKNLGGLGAGPQRRRPERCAVNWQESTLRPDERARTLLLGIRCPHDTLPASRFRGRRDNGAQTCVEQRGVSPMRTTVRTRAGRPCHPLLSK